MKFVRISPTEGFSVVNGEGTLKELYSWIGCTTVEVTYVNICGKEFNVVCDEEGLLNNNNIVSIYKKYQPVLVGTIIIGLEDPKYDKCAIGLSLKDIKLIADNVKTAMVIKNDKIMFTQYLNVD